MSSSDPSVTDFRKMFTSSNKVPFVNVMRNCLDLRITQVNCSNWSRFVACVLIFWLRECVHGFDITCSTEALAVAVLAVVTNHCVPVSGAERPRAAMELSNQILSHRLYMEHFISLGSTDCSEDVSQFEAKMTQLHQIACAFRILSGLFDIACIQFSDRPLDEWNDWPSKQYITVRSDWVLFPSHSLIRTLSRILEPIKAENRLEEVFATCLPQLVPSSKVADIGAMQTEIHNLVGFVNDNLYTDILTPD